MTALRFYPVSFLLLLLLPAISCAKVGDPLPPLPAGAVEVNDLQFLQSGDEAYLTFPHPVRELSEIEIYRLCEGEADSIRETSPVQRVPGAEIRALEFLDRSCIQIMDGNLSPGCVFAIRTRNLRDKRSGFSNEVKWTQAGPVHPPVGLKAETARTRIRIEWEHAAGTIETREADAHQFLVNFREITGNNYYSIDDFSFGEALSFEVRTIARKGGAVYLSEPVSLENFVPEDIFPPQDPSGLVVVLMQDKVQLTWDDNQEKDLAGYYVYRSSQGGKPEKISSLLTINRFVDETPPDLSSLTYTVTAVDIWDNESAPGKPMTD